MNPSKLRAEIDAAGGLLDTPAAAAVLGVSRQAVRQRVIRAAARDWSGFARPVAYLFGADNASVPLWTAEQMEEQRDLDDAGRRGDEVGE